MARIEWVRLRLENWALWKVSRDAGGLGFASRSSFLREAPPTPDRESRIPIDEIDASITDDAVESIKLLHPEIYVAVQCMYPRGLGVSGTQRVTGIKRATIYSHLDQADRLLRTWFTERAEKRAADAARLAAAHPQRSFTT